MKNKKDSHYSITKIVFYSGDRAFEVFPRRGKLYVKEYVKKVPVKSRSRATNV
jgi:hypothetical protein